MTVPNIVETATLFKFKFDGSHGIKIFIMSGFFHAYETNHYQNYHVKYIIYENWILTLSCTTAQRKRKF